MTTLTRTQTMNLLAMLRQLESDIDTQRIIIKQDGITDEDRCPALAHAKIKHAIQAGSEHFIIGSFAVVRL